MRTQRVNVYLTHGTPVYFIEQYSPEIRDWVNVGPTYSEFKYADNVAGLHNAHLVLEKLLEGKK